MIEEIIKKAIADFKLEIANIDTNIKAIQATRSTLNNKLLGAITELQKVCPHTDSKVVQGEYYSAGYDYYSETHYTIECINCGKVLENACTRGTSFA